MQLQRAHLRLQLRGLALEITKGGRVVLGLGQVQQLRSVVQRGDGGIEARQLLLEPGAFLAQRLRLLGIVPDVRDFEFAGYFLETFLLAVVVKETP